MAKDFTYQLSLFFPHMNILQEQEKRIQSTKLDIINFFVR